MSKSLANRFRLPMERTLRVIHLCFISVFLLTTFLFWQQGQLFSHGYRTSQLSHLESVIAHLESKAQYKIDNLRYLRRIFTETMDDPIFPGNSYLLSQMEERAAGIYLRFNSLPLSDSAAYSLEQNNDESVSSKRELYALRKIQDLFPLSKGSGDFPAYVYYISRKGQFIASLSSEINSLLISSYNPQEKQGTFVLASPILNPKREPFWTRQNLTLKHDTLINGALPVDFRGEWVGLLGIAFTDGTVRRLLQASLPAETQSAYQLYDEQLNPLTTKVGARNAFTLNKNQLKKIGEVLQSSQRGTLRFGHVYVTFGTVVSTQAILISTQTISQGLHEDFGRFSVLLVVMWFIVMLILWASHGMICRLVRNMGSLQQNMHWHALHDDLTGALNRRGFFEKTAELSPKYVDYTLVQLDLDHFKKVNDRYGHQVGDRVLVLATQCIQQGIRNKDVLGRIGGEEFCVYLPDTHLEAGIAVAKRIKKQLENSLLTLKDGSRLQVTASLGVAAHSEQPENTLEQVQSLADIRLYCAKQRGRNQVCAEGESEEKA